MDALDEILATPDAALRRPRPSASVHTPRFHGGEQVSGPKSDWPALTANERKPASVEELKRLLHGGEDIPGGGRVGPKANVAAGASTIQAAPKGDALDEILAMDLGDKGGKPPAYYSGERMDAPAAEQPPEPPDVDLSEGRAERAKANGWSEQDQLLHDTMPDANPTPRDAARGFMGVAGAGLGGMAARALPGVGQLAGRGLVARAAGGAIEGAGAGAAQQAVTHEGGPRDLLTAMALGAFGGAAEQPSQGAAGYKPQGHEPRTQAEFDAATLARGKAKGTLRDPAYKNLPEGSAGTHQLAKETEQGIARRMVERGKTRRDALETAESDVNDALERAAGGVPEPIDYGPNHYGDTMVLPREKMSQVVPRSTPPPPPEAWLGPNDYEPPLDKTQRVRMDSGAFGAGPPTPLPQRSTVLHYMDPELEQLAQIRQRRTSDVAGPLDDESYGRMLKIEKGLGAPQATAEEAHRAAQEAEWMNVEADAALVRARTSGNQVHAVKAERLQRRADDMAAKADELIGKADPSPVSFNDVRKLAKEGNLRIKNRIPGDMATAADQAAAGVLAEGSRRLDPRTMGSLEEGPWATDAPVNFGEALDRYGAGERSDATIGENLYGKEGSRPPDGLSKEEAARVRLSKVGTTDVNSPETVHNIEDRVREIERRDPQSRDLIDRIRLRNTKERRQLSGAVPYSFSTLGMGKWLAHEKSNLLFKLHPPAIDDAGMAYKRPPGEASQALPLELQLLLMQNRRQEGEP
jgi:hypothetical protein